MENVQGHGTGYVGIAPDVKILPVVTQSGPAYAKGIRFAVDHGAQVINLSQGLPTSRCPPHLQEAVAYALNKDVVIIAGAGNSGLEGNPSMAPANCKGVVSVGAIDWRLKPWEKTERQPYVDIAAPGVHTAVLMRDGKLYNGSGTSDATAFTSAAVALIRAKHPTMTNRELVRQLIASAMDIHKKGRDDSTGYGLIRPYRPLAGKAPQGTGNPVFEEFDRWMKYHLKKHETLAPASPDDNSSSHAVVIVPAIVAGMTAIFLFVYLYSRRKPASGKPPLPGSPGFHPLPGPPMGSHLRNSPQMPDPQGPPVSGPGSPQSGYAPPQNPEGPGSPH